MNILERKEICDLFDRTNLTIKQVARQFGLTEQHVKKILMNNDDVLEVISELDAWGEKQ